VRTCGSSAGAQLRGAAGVIGELGLLPVAQVFFTSLLLYKLPSLSNQLGGGWEFSPAFCLLD
jgi:hypothetical protein